MAVHSKQLRCDGCVATVGNSEGCIESTLSRWSCECCPMASLKNHVVMWQVQGVVEVVSKPCACWSVSELCIVLCTKVHQLAWKDHTAISTLNSKYAGVIQRRVCWTDERFRDIVTPDSVSSFQFEWFKVYSLMNYWTLMQVSEVLLFNDFLYVSVSLTKVQWQCYMPMKGVFSFL